MKKIITILLLSTISTTVYAEGVMDVSAQINSRIFSTQAAQPMDTLERTNFTNNAIMHLENKQNPHADIESENQNLLPVQEKVTPKNFFKGFRVIW